MNDLLLITLITTTSTLIAILTTTFILVYKVFRELENEHFKELVGDVNKLVFANKEDSIREYRKEVRYLKKKLAYKRTTSMFNSGHIETNEEFQGKDPKADQQQRYSLLQRYLFLYDHSVGRVRNAMRSLTVPFLLSLLLLMIDITIQSYVALIINIIFIILILYAVKSMFDIIMILLNRDRLYLGNISSAAIQYDNSIMNKIKLKLRKLWYDI